MEVRDAATVWLPQTALCEVSGVVRSGGRIGQHLSGLFRRCAGCFFSAETPFAVAGGERDFSAQMGLSTDAGTPRGPYDRGKVPGGGWDVHEDPGRVPALHGPRATFGGQQLSQSGGPGGQPGSAAAQDVAFRVSPSVSPAADDDIQEGGPLHARI